MKIKVLRATLAVVTALAFGSNAIAQTVDVTRSVGASATVGGVTSMLVTPSSIVFGSTTVNSFPTTPADKKILITYASNYDPWLIQIYTDNTNVPNFGQPDGRYAKGGLAKTDGTAVVPLKWICQDDGSTTPATVPDKNSLYNYVKDKRDEDDPATPVDDESWAAALADGYPNIAFGNPGSGFCVDPTNPPTYNGDAADGTIAVYLAALFGDYPPAAGSYNSSVYFDLVHE